MTDPDVRFLQWLQEQFAPYTAARAEARRKLLEQAYAVAERSGFLVEPRSMPDP